MNPKELIDRLTTDREWAQANEWESPICLQDDLSAAIAAVEKLEAYEDTGLDPEEINGLKLKLESSEMSLRVACDALENFTNAEQDGRLVVLPCGEDAELKRNGHTFKADHWNHSLTAFRDAPETKSGKQVALFSIEEAEAALKGGEG